MADRRTVSFDETARPALLCVDVEAREIAVAAALEELGYSVELAPNAEEAIERMRKTTYPVVVVDEEFGGTAPLDNPVLAALRAMSMAQRRWTFVALVGREFKTFDNAMAFARSVNVVVNVNDLPHLPAILKKGITDHVEFYRTFRQVLTDAGKR